MRLLVLLLGLALTCLGGCAKKNDVILLGMIHSGHRDSELYALDVLEEAIRRIEPDAILAEIPPASMADADRQFAEAGSITAGRVRVFPEYTDVVFPLRAELGYDIVPTAAWTPEMAADRREKLDRWKTERATDSQRVQDAMDAIPGWIEAAGGREDDPLFIHTTGYDAIVARGLTPYNALFNEDLGLGGWDSINAAHWALIDAELDRRSGRGETLAITFGAWHKHWFMEALAERRRDRGDIAIIDPKRFFGSR